MQIFDRREEDMVACRLPTCLEPSGEVVAHLAAKWVIDVPLIDRHEPKRERIAIPVACIGQDLMNHHVRPEENQAISHRLNILHDAVVAPNPQFASPRPLPPRVEVQNRSEFSHVWTTKVVNVLRIFRPIALEGKKKKNDHSAAACTQWFLKLGERFLPR